MLKTAEGEYEGKSIIAFIGKVRFGKTVVSTLMYDVLSNTFLREYRKSYDVRPIKGYDDIVKLHSKMLKGRFPGGTLPETKSEIVVELSTKTAPVGKIDLFLRDASGEDLRNVLFTTYDNPDQLLELILTKHKKPNEPIGPLSYLIFAKLYVILIDCSKFEEWRSEQTEFSRLVNCILDIKNRMGKTTNGKIIDPIAIVFTKSDLLTKYIAEGKLKKETLANDLLKNELPLLHSTLNRCHAGKLACFQFSIKDVEVATADEARLMAEEEQKESYEKIKKDAMSIAENVRDETIERRVENAMNKKRTEVLKRVYLLKMQKNKRMKWGRRKINC